MISTFLWENDNANIIYISQAGLVSTTDFELEYGSTPTPIPELTLKLTLLQGGFIHEVFEKCQFESRAHHMNIR